MVRASGQEFCLATGMEQTSTNNPHVCTGLSDLVFQGTSYRSSHLVLITSQVDQDCFISLMMKPRLRKLGDWSRLHS